MNPIAIMYITGTTNIIRNQDAATIKMEKTKEETNINVTNKC